ncbi:VWA domain-containing protein [Sesbania bispinosa]|nr:VWA domain-containing protein [Sesbania bispinosa]
MYWSNKFEWAILNKMKIKQVDGVWQYAYEGVIEQCDHAEVAPESPIAGTTNVTHVQSVNDNIHRILTAIEGLHDTMIEHHNKVEKKIEEMVNHILVY